MSLCYDIAVAMFDRQVYLEQFTPERIVEPAVVALARRVEIEIDDEIDRAYPEVYGGRVTVVTRDGRTISKRVDYSRGTPENPMSHAEVERKFMSLAGAAVGTDSAAAILAQANRVFTAGSVAPLNALLTNARITENTEAVALA